MIVVDCGCGKSYTLEQFRALPGGGYCSAGLPGVELELRHCSCGSTRAINVASWANRRYLTDGEVAGREALWAVTSCEGCGEHFTWIQMQPVRGAEGRWCGPCHDNHPLVLERARADMNEDDAP